MTNREIGLLPVWLERQELMPPVSLLNEQVPLGYFPFCDPRKLLASSAPPIVRYCLFRHRRMHLIETTFSA